MALRALVEEGRQRLERSARPEGGWGYHPGGELFVEPTALALLALMPGESSEKSPPSNAIPAALRSMLACRHGDGSFGTAFEDPEPSWATSPALLALAAYGKTEEAATAGRFLVRWHAPSNPPPEAERREVKRLVRIDLAIRGWPWQAGEDFGTVEPTSLACIALRAWKNPEGGARLAEGMAYLLDRACPDGGWNYGNPYFLDDALPSVALPSVKALLALALCGADSAKPRIARSASAIAEMLRENPSRKANAWGSIAFAAIGNRPLATHHAEMAVDSNDGFGPWFGGADVTALAVLAARAASDDAPACFALARP